MKNYKTALAGYRAALRAKAIPDARAPQVDLRVARCLSLIGQWDAALTEGAKLVIRYKGMPPEARVHSWLMGAYLTAPHEAWKIGERYYRTQELPQTDAADQPERVSLDEEDARKALQQGEAAKTAWEKVRRQLPSTDEEASLCADLATVLGGDPLSTWAQPRRWRSPDDESWKVDPSAAYDPSWPPPKKILYLLLAAEKLGSGTQKPLARLAQALWLRGYQALMPNFAWREDEPGKRKPIPYPYQDRLALGVLRGFLKDYPRSSEAEHARLMVGQWLEADAKYEDALSVYRALVKELPNSKWASDANAAIAGITRASVSMSPETVQAPGKKATFGFTARNVPSVKFSAHRIKLEELVKDPRVLEKPAEGIEDLFRRLGKLKGVRKFYRGDPVTWEVKLAKEGSHEPVTREIQAPLTRNGAYVIEADGGPVREATLLLISDLAILQIVEAEKANVMVVNADSGAPVFEANTLFREVYQVKGKQRVVSSTVTTNADGLAERERKTGVDGSYVMAFAWKGDRYAFTNEGTANLTPEEQAKAAAYVYTERPVYRPAQTVYYRALLAGRGDDGRWKALPEQKVRVRVTDPRGAEVETRTLTAGEFGTVHGGFQLNTGAALGHVPGRGALGRGKGVGRARQRHLRGRGV